MLNIIYFKFCKNIFSTFKILIDFKSTYLFALYNGLLNEDYVPTKICYLKSLRHEPGDARFWPAPSAPASVCYKTIGWFIPTYFWTNDPLPIHILINSFVGPLIFLFLRVTILKGAFLPLIKLI